MAKKKAKIHSQSEPEKPYKYVGSFLNEKQLRYAIQALPMKNQQGLLVPARPFKHGLEYIAFQKNAKIRVYLISQNDIDFLFETFGGWDFDKIRNFLLTECNIRVVDLPELTWRQIISLIRYRKMQNQDNQSKSNRVEKSLPLPLKKWADIFGMSSNTLRKLRKESIYHFEQVGKNGRKWRLPLNEIPAEYLEKYRHITKQR